MRAWLRNVADLNLLYNSDCRLPGRDGPELVPSAHVKLTCSSGGADIHGLQLRLARKDGRVAEGRADWIFCHNTAGDGNPLSSHVTRLLENRAVRNEVRHYVTLLGVS